MAAIKTLRDALLPVADALRTIGGDLGLRQVKVVVRRRVWTGGPAGRGPGALGATKTDTDVVMTNQTPNGVAQNVRVQQISRAEAFASGGQLTSRDLRVGPITPKFLASAMSPGGGFDDTTLDPVPTGAVVELIWIVSSPNGTYGIPPGGVICEKKGEEATSLHTNVILRSTGRAPT